MSNKLRRIFKSITWRMTATTTTILIVYFLSGELKVAGGVALLEVIFKTIIYYLHETIWDKFKAIPENKRE
ncbi:DUF2061 domain-containing protein [Selenihalanaerobacter shriftii]|uniref:Uncharacterized membrane protein n=1 Tax=Selenihalanaerobacter shriftii TaxID=142842 RepID=A0A1T4R636_9FIRM|nr:DUF2061 domain-containing protein [Selenihalanaerobacter shriftii]SKA11375.1 Uncharacterized membrane protein [Selenihalanaerobacter shriftii]